MKRMVKIFMIVAGVASVMVFGIWCQMEWSWDQFHPSTQLGTKWVTEDHRVMLTIPEQDGLPAQGLIQADGNSTEFQLFWDLIGSSNDVMYTICDVTNPNFGVVPDEVWRIKSIRKDSFTMVIRYTEHFQSKYFHDGEELLFSKCEV